MPKQLELASLPISYGGEQHARAPQWQRLGSADPQPHIVRPAAARHYWVVPGATPDRWK